MGFIEDAKVELPRFELGQASAYAVVRRHHDRRIPPQLRIEIGADRSLRGDSEMLIEFADLLFCQHLGANHECAIHAFSANQFAQNQARADGLPEPDIIGNKSDRKSPAKRDQVLDLVVKRLQIPIAPIRCFDVRFRIDNDRIDQTPF